VSPSPTADDAGSPADGREAEVDRGDDHGTDGRGDDAGTDDLRSQAGAFLDRRFGIDSRGLAALRIALGLLVLADLLLRGQELATFYTDTGVLPRATHEALYPTLARLSIHTVTGSTAGQAVLFLLAGAIAVAMVAGYRTRLATAGVAFLHVSMYARNPHLTNGGDGLLALALFLGVFLPLGERWSVDALRTRAAGATPRSWVASMATATFLAQPVVVYLANAAFKLQSDVWMGGTAVQIVLELEQFSVRLGPHLTAYPALLAAINWLWVAMLVASPLLVLATGWRRSLVVAGFALAHLGMLATMRLGLFPLVVVGLLLAYLPPSVWERIERRLQAGRDLQATFQRALAGRLGPARGPRLPTEARRGGRVAVTVFLAVVLVASVAWPATAVGLVDADGHGAVPNLDGYTWRLFAPYPPTATTWFVAPATLETGERIDAFDGSSVEWGPPPDAADTYPSTLWHRYLGDVRWGGEGVHRSLADHLCRRAGGYADAEVTEVSVYVLEQPVPSAGGRTSSNAGASGGGETERTELVRHDCANGS
jgi:hypothetical protein